MAALKAKKVDDVEKKSGRVKCLIEGPVGEGKTTALLDCPDSYFVDCEDGAKFPHYLERLKKAGGLYLGIDDGAGDMSRIIDELKIIATDKTSPVAASRKFFIMDTISKAYQNEIAREQERLDKSGKEDAFGASKKPAVKLSRRLAYWIQQADINVIMVAHQIAEYGIDKHGVNCRTGTTFDGWPLWARDLDLWLVINKTAAVRLATVKKTRLKGFVFNEQFPWNYDEFAKRMGADAFAPTMQTVLISPKQKAELERLFSIIKPDEEQISKWLKWADEAPTLDEMSEVRAAKLITQIQNRINGADEKQKEAKNG